MAVLGIIGFLGFIGCLVWLIVAAIRKQKKRNSLIGMGMALVLFIIGVANSSASQTVPTSTASETSTSAASSGTISSVAPASSASAASVAAPSSKASISKSPVSSAPTSSGKSVADTRKTAKSISYKELARYPDKYKNQYIKFSGKVVQSIDNDDSFTLRVAQDEDYDSVFLVSYVPLNEARVLEDDKITVYGTYQGVQSYTSTLGGQITVPYVLSWDIDIKS